MLMAAVLPVSGSNAIRTFSPLLVVTMTEHTPAIAYPALLSRKGYFYLAKTSLELCAHPRSLFDETVQRAKAGEWSLLDSSGRQYDIGDWKRIPPFGGLRSLGHRLLFSVFAAPVLRNERQLPIEAFKMEIARVVSNRHSYGPDKLSSEDMMTQMSGADSYKNVMALVPPL